MVARGGRERLIRSSDLRPGVRSAAVRTGVKDAVTWAGPETSTIQKKLGHQFIRTTIVRFIGGYPGYK